MVNDTVLQCDLSGIERISRGKVREIFDIGDAILMVATDRISAFDVVMKQGIPDKGKVLSAMTCFWFDMLDVPNHMIASDIDAMPETVQQYRQLIEGRALLVKKLKIFPVECIVRGYLAGAGWKSYRKTGAICGISLPSGLKQSQKLPEPIFTPTTKAETGHDMDMSFEEMENQVGKERAAELKEKSIAVYRTASEYAATRGIILCDTKFEWGMLPDGGEAILADEVLTPDSSRFWPGAEYEVGRPQPSFDKQYLRDWLEGLDWDKTPPPPDLTPEIIEGTSSRYKEIYGLLSGKRFGG